MSSSDDSSSWEQVAKLTVGSAGDNFGSSVAISDGTIVVGAHCDDDKGSDSGSVYVFEMSSPGDASSFTQVAKLTAADGAARRRRSRSRRPTCQPHRPTTISTSSVIPPRIGRRSAASLSRPRRCEDRPSEVCGWQWYVAEPSSACKP